MSTFTPYQLLNSINYRYKRLLQKKTMGRDLHMCKVILDTFRSSSVQDYEIIQLVDYICTYIISNKMPQSFPYTASILLRVSRDYPTIKAEYKANTILDPSIQIWITNKISKLQ